MANYVEVNPKMLRWAIDRSGLSTDDFKQPVEEWLNEESQPTFSKLEAFAKKAMVPFGYLFLSEPPAETLPIPDYRTRTDDGVTRPSPNLLETIFDMQRRQDWMREYLLEQGHGELSFVGSAKVGQSVKAVANSIRGQLKLPPDWARRISTVGDALRLLRERIEDIGVLVCINGVVGNNTSRSLDADEFQGFVLADRVVPLIFVNGADFKAAQVFTIGHELAHVWVGEGALFNHVATNTVDVKLEKYCNLVAAELLVPADSLEGVFAKGERLDTDDYVKLARLFKVSPIVIARRAQELKFISTDEFFRFYNQYREELERKPKRESSGGDFWRTQNVRIGKRFGRAVVAAAKEGRLSYSDAYELTHLQGKTFDKYVDLLRQEGGA